MKPLRVGARYGPRSAIASPDVERLLLIACQRCGFAKGLKDGVVGV